MSNDVKAIANADITASSEIFWLFLIKNIL